MLIRNAFICLILILFSNQIYGQRRAERVKIDSLHAVLASAKSDSLKFVLYRQIAAQYVEVASIDTALVQLNDAVKLTSWQSLHKQRALTLAAIAKIYYNKRDSTALGFLRKSISAYSLSKDKASWVVHKNLLGYYLIQFEDFDQAYKALLKALNASNKSEYYKTKAYVHTNFGYLFTHKGEYDSAIVHLIKNLEYNKLAGKDDHPASLLNIGVNYFHSENYNKAIEYYLLAIEAAEKTNYVAAISVAHQNIGAAYTQLEDFEKAVEYLSMANEQNMANADSVAMSIYHTAIGDIRRKQGDLDEAQKSYRKAHQIFPKSGSKTRRMFVHMNLAAIFLDNSKSVYDVKSAVDEGEYAYKLAEETQQTKNMGECAKILFDAYEKLENYKSANEYGRIYMEIKDSLLSEDRINAIANVQAKFETEKKELEIELLSKENELKDEKIYSSQKDQKKQKDLNTAIFSGLVVSLILIVLLFRQASRRKKVNLELIEKNATISKQDNEKALLLKEIHHRVKNNLQVVSSLLQLQSNNVTETERAALEEGQSRVRAMALIHEKLYQTENISEINMNEYCLHLCRDITNVFGGRQKVKFSIEVEKIWLDIDTAVPVGLMINELVTNAFKYAFKDRDGFLNIRISLQEPGIYEMTVADSGPGLPPELDWRKSKGLGLRLINMLTRQLYGSVEYKNGDLSTFIIIFKDTLERKKIE